MTNHPRQPTFTLPDAESAAGMNAEEYASSQGIALLKQDGRVIVRLAGSVDAGRGPLAYDLVPGQGVLARTGKWRNMAAEDQIRLIAERANAEVAGRLQLQVQAFVRDFIGLARRHELDPVPFLVALSDRASSDPVEFVLRAIEQRFANALEKHVEIRHAERTRDKINLAEYPESFDLARRLPRRFIALLGPTNSGKTHEAMEALVEAGSGAYLAPLRLLALENYERLCERLAARGATASLVTGEERRIEEGATHVASTVEMLDLRKRVDVVVIDEIQMLADPERGSAWTAAVCGAPAPVVYLVGALEARGAVEALARRLGVPLEIRTLQRKGPLTMQSEAVWKVRNLRKGDAVIAFSRRDVLMWRDLVTEAGFSVATVYGNLSPEVRRAQAERFRQGSAEIVVGTDAIAMGLNLPIERVVFTTSTKFNGKDDEELPAALARQIAGRAGRFGVHEEGYVAGFDAGTHGVVRALLRERPLSLPVRGFYVAPTLEHLQRISQATGEQSLAKLLKRFARNVETADGFFIPRITEDQAERALWLDTLPLPLEDKFTLSLVPVSARVTSLNLAWQKWAANLSRSKVTTLDPSVDYRRQSLQDIEDLCKLYSAYAWLGYRRPAYFPDTEVALELARKASTQVDVILAAHNKAQRKRFGEQRRGRRQALRA